MINEARRLLWVTVEPPDVGGGGGHRRQHFLLQALKDKWAVDVLVASPEELTPQLTPRVLRRLAPQEVAPLRWTTAFDSRVLQHLEARPTSALLLAHIETASAVPRLLRRHGASTVIDMHNVYSRFHESRGSRLAALSWRRLEDRILGSVHGAAALSEQEAAPLLHYNPRVSVVPNGVDPTEWPAPQRPEAPTIAMFGSWSHTPNAIGLTWFLEHVWPAVRSAKPQASLHLYGPGQPATAPGVHAHGRVGDLGAHLARHAVIIVPIVRGVGTRVKFIEALATGVPVVSTPLGAEGYDLPQGLFYSADGPVAFAAGCLRAFDRAEARYMAQRARAHVLNHWSWERVCEPLDDLLRTCA